MKLIALPNDDLIFAPSKIVSMKRVGERYEVLGDGGCFHFWLDPVEEKDILEEIFKSVPIYIRKNL